MYIYTVPHSAKEVPTCISWNLVKSVVVGGGQYILVLGRSVYYPREKFVVVHISVTGLRQLQCSARC